MKRSVAVAVCALLAVGLHGAASAQWPDLKLKQKIPGLADLFKKKPPLTTDLDDAVTEVPFLDDYHATGAVPLSALPRARDGTFVIREPGHYMIETRSYCLEAGTYAPGEGDGYLMAPLEGPWSDIIRNVLQRSALHPEIAQKDVQILLWAILSRTKIEEMWPEAQEVAAKLLTRKELARVNGGALGPIPRSVREQAMASLPPEAQRLLEIEAELREALTTGVQRFEEIERLAVLQGEPPPQEGDRLIPRGRWSYHPDGFFVRYFPRDYRRTLVEIHVPAPIDVERDALGRIARLSDADGCVIEADYEDPEAGESAAGPLRAYAFRSVYCERADPGRAGETLRARWSREGWTFVGEPVEDANLQGLASRFAGARARHDRAREHERQLQDLAGAVDRAGRSADRVTAADFEPLMALAHLSVALGQLATPESGEGVPWQEQQTHLIKGAWQWALVEAFGAERHFPAVSEPTVEPAGVSGPRATAGWRAGSARALPAVLRGRPPVGLRLASDEGGDDEELGFDLSPDGAQPGKGGSQRLGQSNDGSEMDDSCAGWYAACKEQAEDDWWKCGADCVFYDKGIECVQRCGKDWDHHRGYCRKWAQNCLEGKGLPDD